MNINRYTMGAVDLKNMMIDYINNADERLLKVLKAVVESYNEETIVAYSVEGTPLTKKQYQTTLTEAEDAIEKGEYITQEDLEKESENW
jgi:adenosylmethionine-8-amino-7-oxononanoate aminotransferase